MNPEEFLWYRKYIPQTMNDYVFKNDQYKNIIEKFIKEQDIPHLLLHGPAGTGKSSIAQVLVNELGIEQGDVLRLNLSKDTSINIVRDEIEPFVSTYSFGKFKVVIGEECENLSVSGQKSLKAIIEDNSQTSRFIFTTNHINRVIPELKSRMRELHIDKMDNDSYILKAAEILMNENVSFEPEILLAYSNAYYPDLRKLINNLQVNVINNALLPLTENNNNSSDFELQVIKLIQEKRINEARKLICSTITVNQVDDFFTFLYENLDIWGKSEEVQAEALIIIRDGYRSHPLMANWEINISATLIELSRLLK